MHHNLISAVYKCHHIPEQIDHLVKDLYSNFNTTIMTSHFKTPFIKVGRGVLQGDCLSPLTFNMCFNTFIQYIKSQKFKANFEPLHWFQFADDASVISDTEHENQILLNACTRWCQWSMMIIRVDKCKTFGMAKIGSQCKQYLPKLFLNDELVPQVKLEESFTYLGRHFNPKQAGGGGVGGIRPQAGSSLCCAETVSSRKLKLSEFYYILIGLNSECKPVPWDIHCCHGNAIVEGCSVEFWLKSVENCSFLLKSFSNLSLGLLFVISISKLFPIPNFEQIG